MVFRFGKVVVLWSVLLAALCCAHTENEKELSTAITLTETILEDLAPPQAEKQLPCFPEKRDMLGHIFRKGEGHFSKDTPSNRQYILAAVSSPKNRVPEVKNRELYLKIMPDERQAWAVVRNNVVRNGGVNPKPLAWVPNPNPKSKRSGLLMEIVAQEEVKGIAAADRPKFKGGRQRMALEAQKRAVKYIYEEAADFSISDTSGFEERIQINHLTRSYNSSGTRTAIPFHLPEEEELELESTLDGKEEMDPKGVMHKTGIIPNLREELLRAEFFDTWDEPGATEHLFFIPDSTELSKSEIRQILREVARGVYIYGAVPYFSLHFNQKMQQYPVIHPAYQYGYVGYVLSTLDYCMKGFINGHFFEEQFIEEWNQNPTTDRDFLSESSIDFSAYCEQHLGERSLAFYEIMEELEREREDEITKKVAFSNSFDISFRIIGKQRSIRKSGNLFVLDGDFDVVHRIGAKPSNDEEVAYFQLLEAACQQMCQQVKEMMPRLPGMKKRFDALYLMNFFSYYFQTLEGTDNIPDLDRKFLSEETKICPVLFPPLPETASPKVRFQPASLFEHLPKSKKSAFIACLEQESSSEKSASALLGEALESYIPRSNPQQLLEPEDYDLIAKKLLAGFYLRYRTAVENIEIGLRNMGVKEVGPKFSLRDQITGVKRVIKRIESDIAKTSKMVADLKRKKQPYAEEEEWLSEFIEDKEAAVEFKEFLETWLDDPLKALFGEMVLSFDLVMREVTRGDRSNPMIMLAGGCGLDLHDMMAEEEPMGHLLRERLAPLVDPHEDEAVVRVDQEDLQGILLKLEFKHFYHSEGRRISSAIEYLHPYPMGRHVDAAASQLRDALLARNMAQCDVLILQVSDWNFRDRRGVSLLHYAVTALEPALVEEMIERGAALDARDSQGYTPLHYAARAGRDECLEILLRAAPHLINVSDPNGETALYLAAKNGRLGCVRLLVQKGADTMATPTHGPNALMASLRLGHEEVALELLAAKSIDVNYRLLGGKAAIHFAMQLKLERALKELLKQGADINCSFINGCRPIHLAVTHNWLTGLQILAGRPDFKVDARLYSGRSALDLADPQEQREVIKFLLSKSHR